MSDRERWIVYPLLLLSLGMGIRGKFSSAHDDHPKQIHCEEIDARTVRCGTCLSERTQVLNDLIVGPDEKDARIRMRGVNVTTLDGKVLPQGGVIEVFGGGKPLLVLGGVSNHGEVVLNANAPEAGMLLTPDGPHHLDGLPRTDENSNQKSPK